MSGLYDETLVGAVGVARALRELIPIANPAAGGGLTRTLDGRYTVRVRALHFRLVTDATAANRNVYVQFRDAEGVAFASQVAPVNVTASTTADFSALAGVIFSDWINATPVMIALGDVFLLPGYQIVIAIDNVQAGDQLSRIRLYQESFPTDGPH